MPVKDSAVVGAMMGVTFALTSIAVGYFVIRYVVLPHFLTGGALTITVK